MLTIYCANVVVAKKIVYYTNNPMTRTGFFTHFYNFKIMNKHHYLLIKQAANWLTTGEQFFSGGTGTTPGEAVDNSVDLSPTLANYDLGEIEDPAKDGPIYQDVNPIYLEPDKYGIPKEVAASEIEHHENNKSRLEQEYQDSIKDLYQSEIGTLPEPVEEPNVVEQPDKPAPRPAAPAASKSKKVDAHTAPDADEFLGGGDDDRDFLGKDIYRTDNPDIARASAGIQQQYAQLAAQRQKLMNIARKADVQWEQYIIDRCNRERYRLEAQMYELIRKAKMEQGKDPGKPLHEEVEDVWRAMGNK